MKYIAPRLPDGWLKIVLIAKVILIGGALAFTFGEVRLGDLPLFAADEKAKDGPKPDATAKADTAAKPGAPESDDSADASAPRKSFLDDLLYLPDIQTENAKKQELTQYLTIVERKKQQVDDRINLLKKREALLLDLERSIDTKLKKLEEEMAFFQQTQQKEKQIQKERLAQLIEFYRKMEPKKAAPVFEKLDKDLVVALWKEFPQKQTTNILAVMTPDKAVELSEYFGRLRSAKEYELLKEINGALLKEFEECRGMPKEGASATTAATAPAPK